MQTDLISLFEPTTPERITATVNQQPGPEWHQPPIALTDQVQLLLAVNAPVAIGVSGGKDGSVAASVTLAYLNAIGHTGPRLLIHSDLGRAEWKDSGDICQQLATRLDTELVVVRRSAGDMVDRWLTRWANNVTRYSDLQCVKLILPWSTPSMRFCTSELKSAIIARYLTNRFRGQPIISVTGIRRQESANRAKKPVSVANKLLTNNTRQTSGIDWNPVIEFKEDDVWATHHHQQLPIHPAYSVYGSSRVSCGFCIMAKEADLQASARAEYNHDLLREMVELEITSSFSFQSDRWLGDVRTDLLTEQQRAGIIGAKQIARQREQLEAGIPSHLLFTDGYPEHLPTYSEAHQLGQIRQAIGELLGFEVAYTKAEQILGRYEYLYRLGQLAAARKAAKQSDEGPDSKKSPVKAIQQSLFFGCTASIAA